MQATPIDRDGRTLPQVGNALIAYEDAVREELRLLESGKWEKARAYNEAQVNVRFKVLDEAIQAADITFMAGATQACIIASSGTTLVLFLAAALITGLLQRFERAQRRAGRLADEQKSLRRSEERFRSLVRNASDVIAILDSDANMRYLSPAVERVWGQAASALHGSSLLALVHPEDLARARTLLEQCADRIGLNITGEMRLRRAPGEWRLFDVVANNLTAEPEIGGLVVTCRDITERRAFEEQLAHQAFHDSLTGLPNRALFMDRLQQALARARRQAESATAVLFLDLDNFKLINDSLGHDMGDRLLQEVAARLQECVRPGDTIARLGGDEFTILLEEVSGAEEAARVADRIAARLQTPLALGGREVFITGSIGLALSAGEEGAPLDSLLRDADTAMYQAKTGGKAHHVVFDRSMNARALERLELETDLRRALEAGELRVHYQPIMLLETGRVAEVEALVRWEHPTLGLIQPARFIPIAEETGLIVPLGRWVLGEACRQVSAWGRQYQADPPMSVSVNLSARQLQHAGLVEDVTQALQTSGLPPACLKLEITESVMMQDADLAIQRLNELKALGLRLAVDDFGTGYSSMAYLSRFPLDTLKIDRSFIQRLGQQPESDAIVRAIITLAQTLGLHVTSEGIETPEQLDKLCSLGCDRGQGYFFARPLTSAALSALLATTGYREEAPTAVEPGLLAA